jgi:hypothetical protein
MPRTKKAQVGISQTRIMYAKFCPKNPVRKLSGRKIVAIIVSCFMTTLRRLETVERCVSITLLSRSR